MRILSSKPSRSRWSPTCYLLLLALAASEAAALSQALCSSLNTGSSNQQGTSFSGILSPGLINSEIDRPRVQLPAMSCPTANVMTNAPATPLRSSNTRAVGAPITLLGTLRQPDLAMSIALAILLSSAVISPQACTAISPLDHHLKAHKEELHHQRPRPVLRPPRARIQITSSKL